MSKEEKIVGQCKSSVSKELEKEYLEDLEEELGCPLEVVFKALKQNYVYNQGVNVYGNYDKKFIFNKCEYVHLTYNFNLESFVIESMGIGCYVYPVKLQDYKKTWWLKEDKSE